MIRGTTPTLEYTLPFGTEQVAKAFITLVQNDEIIIDRPMEECNCSGNKISVRLTQEETYKLQCDCIVEIQLVVKDQNDNVIATNISKDRVWRILREGVI